MKNPCRGCINAYVSKKTENHFPCYSRCEARGKYEAKYLEPKRMFAVGRPIWTLDTVLKQEYVMLFGRPRHIQVIQSMQLRTVLNFIKFGYIREAVRKEKTDGI